MHGQAHPAQGYQLSQHAVAFRSEVWQPRASNRLWLCVATRRQHIIWTSNSKLLFHLIHNSIDTMGYRGQDPSSIQILESADPAQICHTPVHDLESIFYILLYFCTKFKCPGNLKRLPKDVMDIHIPMDSRFEPHTYLRKLAVKKSMCFRDFDTDFVDKFPSYFRNFRDCTIKL